MILKLFYLLKIKMNKIEEKITEDDFSDNYIDFETPDPGKLNIMEIKRMTTGDAFFARPYQKGPYWSLTMGNIPDFPDGKYLSCRQRKLIEK